MVFIQTVELLNDYRVRLGFSTGEQKEVNLDPLLRGPIFEPLRRDPALFRAVKVDDELGTIVWPNGADMDPDMLYGSHLPAWMGAEAAVTA